MNERRSCRLGRDSLELFSFFRVSVAGSKGTLAEEEGSFSLCADESFDDPVFQSVGCCVTFPKLDGATLPPILSHTPVGCWPLSM